MSGVRAPPNSMNETIDLTGPDQDLSQVAAATFFFAEVVGQTYMEIYRDVFIIQCPHEKSAQKEFLSQKPKN